MARSGKHLIEPSRRSLAGMRLRLVALWSNYPQAPDSTVLEVTKVQPKRRQAAALQKEDSNADR